VAAEELGKGIQDATQAAEPPSSPSAGQHQLSD